MVNKRFSKHDRTAVVACVRRAHQHPEWLEHWQLEASPYFRPGQVQTV